MQRRFVIAIALICAFASVDAQEDVLRPKGRPEGDPLRNSASKQAGARSHIYVGFDAGLNYNMFSQPYTLTGPAVVQSPEEVLKSGTGVSPAFGLFVDIPVATGVGIQARLGYDGKWFSNSQRAIIDAEVEATPNAVDGFPNVVDMESEASASWKLNTFGIAILARIDLGSQVFLTAGPIVQLSMGNLTREDKLTQIGPENTFIAVDYNDVPGTYQQISRSTNIAQSFLPAVGPADAYTGREYETTRVGLEFGLGYRYDLSPTMFIAPAIRYQFMLSPLNGSFAGADIARDPTQGLSFLSFDESRLHSLVLAVQLGFQL